MGKATKMISNVNATCALLELYLSKTKKLQSQENVDALLSGLEEASQKMNTWKRCFWVCSTYFFAEQIVYFISQQVRPSTAVCPLIWPSWPAGCTKLISASEDEQKTSHPYKLSDDLEKIGDDIKTSKEILADVKDIFKKKASDAKKAREAKGPPAAKAKRTAKSKAKAKA